MRKQRLIVLTTGVLLAGALGVCGAQGLRPPSSGGFGSGWQVGGGAPSPSYGSATGSGGGSYGSYGSSGGSAEPDTRGGYPGSPSGGASSGNYGSAGGYGAPSGAAGSGSGSYGGAMGDSSGGAPSGSTRSKGNGLRTP